MKSSASGHVSETNMTSRSLIGRGVASFLTVFLLLLGTSGAALAHDSLVATSPADGSTVATVPQSIELTMSNTPAEIGSEIQVLDESGTNWADGDVSVLDQIATQAVRSGAPAGKYTVKWRLVSSDSHPVEGEFGFTATAAGGGPSSAAVAGEDVGAGPMSNVSAAPEVTPGPVSDDSAVPWSVIGLIVVLVGVVIAMVVVARRRLSSED